MFRAFSAGLSRLETLNLKQKAGNSQTKRLFYSMTTLNEYNPSKLKKSFVYQSTMNNKRRFSPVPFSNKKYISNNIKLVNLEEPKVKKPCHITKTEGNDESYLEKKNKVSENLKSNLNLFGKNPDFNILMYNDDNVLQSLAVKQRIFNFEIDWDLKMDDGKAICKYKLDAPKMKHLSGQTISTNKKSAKKQAAREILSNLDIPTFEEMSSITHWMVNIRRQMLKAKENMLELKQIENGFVSKIEWKINDVTYTGVGFGDTASEAELYANQDLYTQTYNLNSSEKAKESPFGPELSKSDAGQINTMRNTMISKMKIKQEENIVQIPGGFQCTLTWIWTNEKGVQSKVVVKGGSTKALAKANAGKSMLVEIGTIQDITSHESQQSDKIKSRINYNINEAVNLACELINSSNSTVWTLFLLQLWNKLLITRNNSLVNKLLNTIISQQSDDRDSQKLSSDLWESMLYSLIYTMDEEWVKSILNLLKQVKLNQMNFYSPSSLSYYQKNTIMLCMEYQCGVYNEVMIKSANVNLHKNESMAVDLVRVQLPNIVLNSKINVEYLKNSIFKQDDIVLLLPMLTNVEKDKIISDLYNTGLICMVSKHKLNHPDLNITLKYLSHIDLSDNHKASESVNDSEVINKLFNSYSKFSLVYIKSSIPYIRMTEALQSLTHVIYPINSNSNKYNFTYEMKEILLHSKKYTAPYTNNLMLPTNMSLTPKQNLACISAINSPITLIQGPPGTGKTHVACAIIDSWSILYPNDKILAVADSNIAADNLIDALNKKNINALRIGSSSEYELQEDCIKNLERYNHYLNLKSNGYYKEANNLKILLFSEAIKRNNIVIATCVGSGNDLLQNYQFKRVIIDECSQSIELSNLIPIGKGCESLVLIGDHKQLRPTIISQNAIKLGLDKSLLERLIEQETAPVYMLNIQRRMHPSIIEFPNLHFYQNQIYNQDVNDVNRSPIKGFKWPIPGYNVAFVDVSTFSPSTQFEVVQGKSKLNYIELNCMLAILSSFIKAGDVKPQDIGVLTPYDAQKMILKRHISDKIEVDSVDGFQGKEKELILFSSVRSNFTKDIGFLKDPRRMNVMLTRARRGLIVLGDAFTLMSDVENWKPYLNWIYTK